MTYLVKFDADTQKYIARSLELPDLSGEGSCLSAAIDDLERKLAKLEDKSVIAQQEYVSKSHEEGEFMASITFR